MIFPTGLFNGRSVLLFLCTHTQVSTGPSQAPFPGCLTNAGRKAQVTARLTVVLPEVWDYYSSAQPPTALCITSKCLPCGEPVLGLARLQGLPPAQSWASSHDPTAAEPTIGHSATGKGSERTGMGARLARIRHWTGTLLGRGAPASTPCPSTLPAAPAPFGTLAHLSLYGDVLGVGTGGKKTIFVQRLLAKAPRQEQSDRLSGEWICGRGLPWPAKPRDSGQLLKWAFTGFQGVCISLSSYPANSNWWYLLKAEFPLMTQIIIPIWKPWHFSL